MGFDVVNFGLFERDTHVPVGIFSNMSADWMNHYVASGYMDDDPFFHLAVSSTRPEHYDFDRVDTSDGSMGQAGATMLQETSELGLRSAFMIPFADRNGIGSGFNLGSSEPGYELRRMHGTRLDEIAVGCALAAAVLYDQSFRENAASDGRSADPAGWYGNSALANPLSPREVEALKWLSEGLRNDRIAERMNISNATVHFHVSSAKQKLTAKTREHALAIALTRRYITP